MKVGPFELIEDRRSPGTWYFNSGEKAGGVRLVLEVESVPDSNRSTALAKFYGPSGYSLESATAATAEEAASALAERCRWRGWEQFA